MSGPVSFDDLDKSQGYSRPAKPIWTYDLSDKQNNDLILKWLVGEYLYLRQESLDRLHGIERNLALYRGIQYDTQEGNPQIRDRSDSRFRDVRKVVVNNFFDFIAHRVSRLIKYKPAVAILPTNDEFEDQVSAKATKYLLDHIWYSEQFEGMLAPLVARDSSVIGESYLWIDWDPNKGDYHPDWVNSYKKQNKIKKDVEPHELKKMMEDNPPKIPLLDENGKAMVDPAGNKIYIEKPIKVGDVSYEVVSAYEVFLQKARSFETSEYVFRCKYLPVEALRARYPKLAEKIKASRDYEFYDFSTLQRQKSKNDTVYFEFWHKKTQEMPQGRKICFTNDVILESETHPFSHGEFPFERLTDEDYPMEVYGRASIDNVKGLLGLYNNLTNIITKNQILTSMPKWMMPAGAAKIQSLGNDITIVEYKGPQPPALVQMHPTPNEVFQFRDNLKQDAQQTYGVFGVSRGEPPPGIKAGIALQFLNEQENERFNLSFAKWNDFIRRSAIKTLAIAGDMYDASDERMIKVLGKNNKWMTVFFDAADLSKDYDIRVQNSSALPQSKAARTQTVMDLAQSFPDLMPKEQIVELLELAQPDKFYDQATASATAAEAENELLMDGDLSAPEEFEDHIAHWRIHAMLIRSFAFKNQTPKNIQDKMKDHQLGHEYMMVQKARVNPLYLQEVAMLKGFPMFLSSELLRASMQPPQGSGGAASGSPSVGPYQDVPGAPQNPMVPGGETQLPNTQPQPSLQAQAQGERTVPKPPI